MVKFTCSNFVTFFIVWCFTSSLVRGFFTTDPFQETLIFQERHFSLGESPENRKCSFLQKNDDNSLPLIRSSYEFSLIKNAFCVNKENKDSKNSKEKEAKKDNKDNRSDEVKKGKKDNEDIEDSCFPLVGVGADGENTTIFFKWLLGLRLPRGVKSLHFVLVEDQMTCRPVGPTGLQLQVQIQTSESTQKMEEEISLSNNFLENSTWLQEIGLRLSQSICSNIGESLCRQEFNYSNMSKRTSKSDSKGEDIGDSEGEDKDNPKWEVGKKPKNFLSTILWLPYPLDSLLLTAQSTFDIGKQGGERKPRLGEAIGLWHPSSSESWKNIVKGWPSLFTLEGFNYEVDDKNINDSVIPLVKKLRQRALSLNSSLYSWKVLRRSLTVEYDNFFGKSQTLSFTFKEEAEAKQIRTCHESRTEKTDSFSNGFPDSPVPNQGESNLLSEEPKDPESREDLNHWELTDMWRSLIGRGQHRELITRLKLVGKVQISANFENDKPVDLKKNGEKTPLRKNGKRILVTIGLLEHLPVEVFVDIFEVARLNRPMTVEVFGKIDLESPSTRAQETISFVQVSTFAEIQSDKTEFFKSKKTEFMKSEEMERVEVFESEKKEDSKSKKTDVFNWEKMEVIVEVRLPLHSRYPALLSSDFNNTFKCEKSHVLIKIPTPFLVIKTKTFFKTGIKSRPEDKISKTKNKDTLPETLKNPKSDEDNISKTNNDDDNDGNIPETKNRTWELVFWGREIKLEEQKIVWTIPAGCRGHFEITFWITTSVSFIGALAVIMFTYRLPTKV